MTPRNVVVLLPLLVCSVVCTSSENPSTKDVVTLCQIPIPSDLQDAQFVVTYRFETTKKGKLINIKKVRNEFLGDEPFVACMSGWSLPSVSGQGLAEFFAKPAEGGWTEISVSAKGFKKSFPYHR